MFYLAIQNLGSEEQVKKYLPLINQLKMIGCYAQTELGHGSNVAVINLKYHRI
jgi:acyl-CoA oxidase